MKKKETPRRRLTLNRETILALNDPALLERARGGIVEIGVGTTEGPRNPCVTDIAGVGG